MSHLPYNLVQNGHRAKPLNLQGLDLPGSADSYYEAVFTRCRSPNADSSAAERITVVKKIPGTLNIDEAQGTRYLEYRLGQIQDLKKNNDEAKVWCQDDVERCYHKWMRRILPMGKIKVKACVRKDEEWIEKPSGRNELIATMIEKETGVVMSRKMVSSHIQVIDGYTGRAKHLAHGWHHERALIYMKWGKIKWDREAQRIMPLDSKKVTGDPQYLPHETTNCSVLLLCSEISATKPDILIEEITFGLYASHSPSKGNNGIVHSYLSASKAEGNETIRLEELPEPRNFYRSLLGTNHHSLREQVIFCEAALVIEPEYTKQGYGIGTNMRASIYCRHALRRWCVITRGYVDWDNEICSEKREYSSESTQGNVKIDTELHVSPSYWRDLLMRCSRQSGIEHVSYSQVMRGNVFWSRKLDSVEDKHLGRNGAASEHIAAVLDSACFIQEIFQLDMCSTSDDIRLSDGQARSQRRIAVLLWKLKEQKTGKTGDWSWKRVLGPDDSRAITFDQTPKGSRTCSRMQPVDHELASQCLERQISCSSSEPLAIQCSPTYLAHSTSSEFRDDEHIGYGENWSCRKRRRLCPPTKQTLYEPSLPQTAQAQSKKDGRSQYVPVLTAQMSSQRDVRRKPPKETCSIFKIDQPQELLKPELLKRERRFLKSSGFEYESSHFNPIATLSNEALCGNEPAAEKSPSQLHRDSDQDLSSVLPGESRSDAPTRTKLTEESRQMVELGGAQVCGSFSSLPGQKQEPALSNNSLQYSQGHDEQPPILYQPQPRHMVSLPLVTESSVIHDAVPEDFGQIRGYDNPLHGTLGTGTGVNHGGETNDLPVKAIFQPSNLMFEGIQTDVSRRSGQMLSTFSHEGRTTHIETCVTLSPASCEEQQMKQYAWDGSPAAMPSLTQSQTSTGYEHAESRRSHFGDIDFDNIINADELKVDDFSFDQWTEPDSPMEVACYHQRLMMQQIYQSSKTLHHADLMHQAGVTGLSRKQAASSSGCGSARLRFWPGGTASRIAESQLDSDTCTVGQLEDCTALSPYVSDLLEVASWERNCSGTSNNGRVDSHGSLNGNINGRSPSGTRGEWDAICVADASRAGDPNSDHVLTWATEPAIPYNYGIAFSVSHEVPRAVTEVRHDAVLLEETTDEDFELLKSSLQDFNDSLSSVL